MNWLDKIREQGKDYKRQVGGGGTGIGPGGKNICSTPGMKIRSKGLGRGLARGKGRGPIGIPWGGK